MGDPLGGVGIFPGLASEPGDRFIVSGCGPGVVDGDFGVGSEGDSFKVFSEIVENVLTEDDGDGLNLKKLMLKSLERSSIKGDRPSSLGGMVVLMRALTARASSSRPSSERQSVMRRRQSI